MNGVSFQKRVTNTIQPASGPVQSFIVRYYYIIVSFPHGYLNASELRHKALSPISDER